MPKRPSMSDGFAPQSGAYVEESAWLGGRGARRTSSEPVRRHGIHSRDAFFLTALCLTLAACSAGEGPQAGNSAPAETAAAAPAPAAPAASAPAAEPDTNGLASLTAEGWGPLKIGMTLDEVNDALGPDANPQAIGGPEPEQCDQFRPARAPEGMLVMVEQGRLTRISLIRDAELKTDRGIGLGASAAQVRSAYGGEVRSSPHKYVGAPAEYLTVWAKGGRPAERMAPTGSRGIVYEVNDAGTVGAIHAGGPSIQYVEGCA